MIPAIEAEAETSLAPVGVAGVSLAEAVAYVVVGDPVVDESATPVEGAAGVVAVAGDLVGVVGHALVIVCLGGEKVVGREGVENGLCRVGAGGGDVVRDPVVNEAGEIERIVVKEGSGHRGAIGIADCNAIAEEGPVGIIFSPYCGSENIVAGESVVAQAVIEHGGGEPVPEVGRVGGAGCGWIGEELGVGFRQEGGDVASRKNESILQVDLGHPVRVSDLGGDDRILGIGRLLREVPDLADVGWCHGAKGTVDEAGSRGTGGPVGI